MPLLRSNRQRLDKTLSAQEVQQRIIRVGCRPSPLPEPGVLFDLCFGDDRWGAQVREESCSCPHPGGLHRHRLLFCGELYTALDWRVGARISITQESNGQLILNGDLTA